MTFKEHLSTIIRTRQSMAQRVPKARDLSRLGTFPPRICMATLYRVSPIILNENTLSR